MKNRDEEFKMRYNNVKPEKGKMLIAEPFMQDMYFQRSAVLLTEHTAGGSMGLVVNKQTNLYVNSFLEPFSNLPLMPLYLGGPVGFNNLLYIHSLGNQIADSVEIAENLFFLGDFESIVYHLLGDQSNMDKIKFFIGYAGWTAGQLQDEIETDSWLVSDLPDGEDVISAKGESFWSRSVENVGGPYLKWLNYPKSPILN